MLRKKERAKGLTHKVCSSCKEDKPINAFTEAWRAYCADCTSAKARRRYKESGGIEKVYAQNLAANYNLTSEQYAEMVAAQDGRCAICDEKATRRLHVDHNHATGAVRQLLCSHCNHAIGHAKEDPARLRAMIAYLERHATVGAAT
ncbi:endonuclease VII domain-containing protein [Streptomyces sp. NPDC047939]|uniref:endonuclease VII domain-containing protein n=1 Tax=Streptomyces sp. NPDC047939 TaxID=3155381 RepID=UPI003413BC1A